MGLFDQLPCLVFGAIVDKQYPAVFRYALPGDQLLHLYAQRLYRKRKYFFLIVTRDDKV